MALRTIAFSVVLIATAYGQEMPPQSQQRTEIPTALMRSDHRYVGGWPGVFYDGGWENGQPEGYEIMTYSDRRRYEGEWHDGQHIGYDKYDWPSGSHYEGEWLAGRESGKGVMVLRDGGRYEGLFLNGKRSGVGILILRNGDRLEGNWVDDLQMAEACMSAPKAIATMANFMMDGTRAKVS